MENWDDIKWIFEMDGALRDIYISDTELADWEKLIEHLNEHYFLLYGTEESEWSSEIDKDYALKYLTDTTGEMESKTLSVILDHIIGVNCHFFDVREIEFDITPDEIQTIEEFEKLMNFMKKMNSLFKKPIFLTEENDRKLPLIHIDIEKSICMITKKQNLTR